jgi:hypothetical protein
MLADIRKSNEPLDGRSIRPGECRRREPRALPPQAPQGAPWLQEFVRTERDRSDQPAREFPRIAP